MMTSRIDTRPAEVQATPWQISATSTGTPRRVLIVEDDETLAVTLRYNLQKLGYQATVARDGDEALKSARTHLPDLIILDLMLPLIDGRDVCHSIRSWSDIPLLMLTALDGEGAIVAGLEAGADDYVTKPFDMRELLARVQALLRRTYPAIEDRAVLVAGDLTIMLDEHRAQYQERELRLPPKEFQLLVALVRRAGKVCSRLRLLDEVWGEEIVVDPRNVDVHIRYLRAQLQGDPDGSRLIQTVHGIGYRFAGEFGSPADGNSSHIQPTTKT